MARDFGGVVMVLVPPGCFMLGSENGGGDERPVNQQCFDKPSWIDRTEVTQSQFSQLGGQMAQAPYFKGNSRPVDSITWFEARDYCARRGARLPTEAEWEYAERGPDNLVYPWGNVWDEGKAVWSRSVSQGTAYVGSIPNGASWVGAIDMIGNVWEWTSSLYKPYPYAANDGRESNSDTSNSRVLRGGSWDNNAALLHAADRSKNNPSGRNDDVGFRCARSS